MIRCVSRMDKLQKIVKSLWGPNLFVQHSLCCLHSFYYKGIKVRSFLYVSRNDVSLLTETCESSMCPVAKVTECDRYLTDYHSRVHVCSTKYDINFLCDTKTDGGGWIIFQRRVHKYVTFERNWDEYKYGFGKICKDYWLGNDHIHRITSQRRVGIKD
ncbi:Ficolin-1-A [Bulinus truncatus]|nr:Ficolin-1-A [Bulinus truncatus]